MNTEQSNKLIAEFAGIKIRFDMMGNETFNPNKDWSDLMPVVEKIGNLFHQVKIEINEGFPYCEILCYSNNKLSHEIKEVASKPKLAVHQAIIAFIKWYNKQHSSTKPQ